MGSAQSTGWQATVKEKRAEREAKLPTKWKIETGDLPSDDVTDVIQLCRDRKWLTDTELIMTESTMVELAAAIKNKEYTAVQVVEAFAHRATIAQQLVNW
jgi:amidase